MNKLDDKTRKKLQACIHHKDRWRLKSGGKPCVIIRTQALLLFYLCYVELCHNVSSPGNPIYTLIIVGVR